MALQKVAGEKLYIGGVLSDKAADFVASDFSSQTWTLIDGYSSRPPIGDEAVEIATDLINRGRTIVQKGTRRSPTGEHRFAAIANDAGQVAMKAAASSNSNYAFRLVKDDATSKTSTVTITIASPGVVTWASHGLQDGNTISFTTTGALPTGLTAGTTYYVKYVDANTFQLAATSGGTAIVTSGTQSGTHTATAMPSGTTLYYIGLVMSKSDQGGEANTASMLSFNVAPNSNIVEVPVAA
ncbi:MAG: hypothetical protein QM647_15085 [Asticcacaulis sp.]|uniref:hypothetical protein n=1 Tax=Asticcacaulis sp. TaxID=1872648 RepID=UPI0039E5BBA8